jgi:hypothetical protein
MRTDEEAFARPAAHRSPRREIKVIVLDRIGASHKFPMRLPLQLKCRRHHKVRLSIFPDYLIYPERTVE